MRIIFMGTPDFAVQSLDILVKNKKNIVAVITSPDKPSGRGQQIQQSAVKKYALENGLNILQPEKFKDESFLSQLRELNADLQIVVAFRMLPEVVWKMPPKGTINLHGSLLPNYRGAAPINWAIINGEKETGVTTFFLQQEIDTGKIIYQEKIAIEPNDDAEIVHDRLMHLGAQLILKTAVAIETNIFPQIDQSSVMPENKKVKLAPKIFKNDCQINWKQSPSQIHDFVRGLSPYPTAYTVLISPKNEEFPLKVFKTEIESKPHEQQIGSIKTDSKTYLKIAVNDGYVHIKDLQLSGKKRMTTVEFLRGFLVNNDWKTKSVHE